MSRPTETVQTCSEAYALALNLHNAAEHHKRTCDENCHVSLGALHRAAVRIMGDTSHTPPSADELAHFKRLVWPF